MGYPANQNALQAITGGSIMTEFKVVQAFVNKSSGGLMFKGNNNEYYPFSAKEFSASSSSISVMEVKQLLEASPGGYISFSEEFVLSQKSLVLVELDLTDPILATPESWDSLLDMI
jgi:hypothetical protein